MRRKTTYLNTNAPAVETLFAITGVAFIAVVRKERMISCFYKYLLVDDVLLDTEERKMSIVHTR